MMGLASFLLGSAVSACAEEAGTSFAFFSGLRTYSCSAVRGGACQEQTCILMAPCKLKDWAYLSKVDLRFLHCTAGSLPCKSLARNPLST